VDWDAWRENYSLVREEIATTYPDIFPDFNQRMWEPGGFHRPIPARHRQWQTDTGKANFIVPHSLGEDPDMPQGNAEGLRLMTLRSDSQFNTTIYSLEDRFRGVKGGRMVILMNRADIEKRHLKEGQKVTLQTVADDGIDRRLEGLEIKAYEIPEGCIGGYYPECNILLPLWHYAKESKVPGAKSIPVRIL
jgi:anaerobic selenocysteine-containing dehydrogenase